MIKTENEALDRRKTPHIIDAVDLDLRLKPCQRITLKNGVEVYAVDAGAEEVMLVEWVFFAGNWYEDRNLQAATTNFFLKNGTSKKSAFQVNEHFEYYGSYFNRSCFTETATLTLHCLNKHIRELLPVVREVLTDSIFPEEELAIYKQNMQQRLAVNMKKSDFVAGRLIDAYLYGEKHPYGRFSRHEDYDTLQRKELLEFYKNYYREGRFIIFVAGRLPKDLETILNDNFGDLPKAMIKPEDIALEPVPEKKHRVTNDQNGVQGSIRMGRPFPNRHHPDFPKAMVLNNLFGGFFGSRLMSNIREEKGYTYGIYSYIQNHIQYTSWLISTEAGRDVCEPTVNEIYHEIDRLRTDLVDDDELMLVRNYMMGTILGDLDGPFQILARWKNLILNGLDEKYFYHSIEIIKSISAEEIRDLAQKYLEPREFYELVVV